jgi:hypothetical protein
LTSTGTFLGLLAEVTGKEPVLEGAQRLMGLFTGLNMRAGFGSGNQVMLAYDLKCSAPIGNLRIAAF